MAKQRWVGVETGSKQVEHAHLSCANGTNDIALERLSSAKYLLFIYLLTQSRNMTRLRHYFLCNAMNFAFIEHWKSEMLWVRWSNVLGLCLHAQRVHQWISPNFSKVGSNINVGFLLYRVVAIDHIRKKNVSVQWRSCNSAAPQICGQWCAQTSLSHVRHKTHLQRPS